MVTGHRKFVNKLCGFLNDDKEERTGNDKWPLETNTCASIVEQENLAECSCQDGSFR